MSKKKPRMTIKTAPPISTDHIVSDDESSKKIILALSKYYVMSFGQLAAKTSTPPDELSSVVSKLYKNGLVKTRQSRFLSNEVGTTGPNAARPADFFWELSQEGKRLPFRY
jgi:DNA-binding transcriptional ArsR family regulator